MPFKRIPLLACAIIFISCTTSSKVITVLFSFPEKITEASAVEIPTGSDKIWTLEDSGNDADLYALDAKGTITHTLKISDVSNNDWEDLTSDENGNLYIGDFGNNSNKRKDLCIYKVNASDLEKASATTSQKISFYYPEQKDFPPKKSEKFYDVEAFFYHNDNFYLFTKNRSSKFDGTTLMYRVPNRSGNHAAQFIGQFITCDNYRKCAITSADISPDGEKLALLSSSKVWVFENFTGDAFLKGVHKEIDLDDYSQKEGICFVTNSKLYIADEKDKTSGGNLYELNLETKN